MGPPPSALSACATVPRLGHAAAKRRAAYETVRTFAAGGRLAAGSLVDLLPDHSSMQLIDEALAGPPTLAQAKARALQAGALARGPPPRFAPQVGVVRQRRGFRSTTTWAFRRLSFLTAGETPARRATWPGTSTCFGRNRRQLAAATSEAQAARAEAAETRLALSTSIAGAYAGSLSSMQSDDPRGTPCASGPKAKR